MPITLIADPRVSDVILTEEEGNLSRLVVTVNMSAGATLPLGTVLARVKSASPAAPYDICKVADLADSATALAREFAILGGDGYEIKDNTTFVTTTNKSAITWIRDVSLKEAAVRALHPTFNDTQWGLLKGALQATQNIRLVPVAAAVVA